MSQPAATAARARSRGASPRRNRRATPVPRHGRTDADRHSLELLSPAARRTHRTPRTSRAEASHCGRQALSGFEPADITTAIAGCGAPSVGGFLARAPWATPADPQARPAAHARHDRHQRVRPALLHSPRSQPPMERMFLMRPAWGGAVETGRLTLVPNTLQRRIRQEPTRARPGDARSLATASLLRFLGPHGPVLHGRRHDGRPGRRRYRTPTRPRGPCSTGG